MLYLCNGSGDSVRKRMPFGDVLLGLFMVLTFMLGPQNHSKKENQTLGWHFKNKEQSFSFTEFVVGVR